MDTKDVKDMESRIIEAAKQVFVRKGYEAATMSDVATEAGIGRTALHYYYRTKEILFEAIFQQLISSVLPNINRILDQDCTIEEKMSQIIEQYVGVVRRNPNMPIFVISELNRDPEHLFNVVLSDLTRIQPILRLRSQLEEEMEKGKIRRIPPVDIFSTIVSLVAFPMLIRKPLSMAFMGNEAEWFDEFMDRRKLLIIDVITQMLKV